jgi:alpha-methylacyl-CoA racemase
MVLRLLEDADALIEGMRPGTMERLQLGPEDCARRNPRLVYGRITGWGQSGPLALAAGHDNNYAALSGALYFNGMPDTPPVAALSLLGDVAGGALYLAIGLLSGIIRARATGNGSVVDAGMVDGNAHMLQLLLGGRKKGFIGGQRGGNMHDSSHFFSTYRCADGEFITVAALEPQFYALLLEKLGLNGDARFKAQWDRDRWGELRAQLMDLFATRTREEWSTLLEGSDACFAPVLSPDEAARHPHNVARGTYFESQGHLQTAPAPRFDGRRVQPGPIAAPGEHTEAIKAALASGSGRAVWR